MSLSPDSSRRTSKLLFDIDKSNISKLNFDQLTLPKLENLEEKIDKKPEDFKLENPPPKSESLESKKGNVLRYDLQASTKGVDNLHPVLSSIKGLSESVTEFENSGLISKELDNSKKVEMANKLMNEFIPESDFRGVF